MKATQKKIKEKVLNAVEELNTIAKDEKPADADFKRLEIILKLENEKDELKNKVKNLKQHTEHQNKTPKHHEVASATEQQKDECVPSGRAEQRKKSQKLNRITLTINTNNNEDINNIIRDIKELFSYSNESEKVFKSVVKYTPDENKTYILMNLIELLRTEEDFIKVIKKTSTIITGYGYNDFSYTYKTTQIKTDNKFNIIYRSTIKNEEKSKKSEVASAREAKHKETVKTKNGFIIDDDE